MSKKDISILVLDDEVIVCERLKEFLEAKDFKIEVFNDSKTAMTRLEEKKFDVVITDLKMSNYTGMDILLFIKENQPATKVILITGYGTLENYRTAQALEAFEIVHKPFQMADIYNLVKKATKR